MGIVVMVAAMVGAAVAVMAQSSWAQPYLALPDRVQPYWA